MSYRYEVDEGNAVRIWDELNPNELNAPFIFQPHWPNGDPWASAEEASAWAELFINTLVDPEAEITAGDSPAEPTKPLFRSLPEPEVTDGSN